MQMIILLIVNMKKITKIFYLPKVWKEIEFGDLREILKYTNVSNSAYYFTNR